MKDIVEFPELNRHYFVRRRVNGAVAKQYEPAEVLELRDGKVQVKWLYDDTEQELMMYYGLVQQLRPAVISQMWRAMMGDIQRLRMQAEKLNGLLS
jgi:hypothetical protein